MTAERTQPVVRGKVSMPTLSRSVTQRTRVGDLIREQVDAHRVVLVTATAGSGKTTAVASALESSAKPVAWLRLDTSDRAAGRLLLYLDQAIRRVLPDLPDGWRTPGHDVTHPERSALLAEAVGDRELILVIDELERIADAPTALETVASFLRYSNPQVRTVLISRQAIELGLARGQTLGEVGQIGEQDLAFTIGEAENALAAVSSSPAEASEAVRATGGWVAGVLFEAWRSDKHVHGTGGEVDPLHGYLSSEIMSRLPDELGRFLIMTSVLDAVTASRAEQLGIADAGDLIAQIITHHLPLDVSRDLELHYHPRFREFLLSRWQLLDNPTQKRLRYAHAELLLQEGRAEEAVDEYLRTGDVAQAEDVAATVIVDVARRLDIDVVARWLEQFRRWRVESSLELSSAELLMSLEREEYGVGARSADRMRRMMAETGQAIDSRLIGHMAWCYFLVGRIEEMYAVLGSVPDDERLATMRYVIGVELTDDPMSYSDRPENPPVEFEGVLSRLDLVHGRYARILDHPRAARGVVRLSQMGALTGLGRLEEAQQIASEITAVGWTAVRLRAELMAESGMPEQAWAELISGRDRLSSTESPLYRSFALLTEAMLALRFKKDTAQAAAALRAVAREPTALERVRILEQLDLWWGLIGLLDGDDARAAERLTAAVDRMRSTERWMMLPTAAVYLAEALWRGGDEAGSDAAADLALTTAESMGSTHGLVRALADFPAVLSRRLDVELDQDGPWHDLGRTLILHTELRSGSQRRSEVHLVEVGDAHLDISGRVHSMKLIKSVELLSYLASAGGSAPRGEVLSALFDSKSEKSANAYLRMAANGVRSALSDPDCIGIDSERVWWVDGSLGSDFADLQVRLRRLRNVSGSHRLRLALEALESAGSGPFLAGARSGWASEHREGWTQLLLDTRHAAAEAAFDVADYGLAHALAAEVLAQDPYRERGWRLAMRIASAIGDSDRVLSLYRQCEKALAEVPTAPAGATRRLLEDLRA